MKNSLFSISALVISGSTYLAASIPDQSPAQLPAKIPTKGAYIEVMGGLGHRYERLLSDLNSIVRILAHDEPYITSTHDSISNEYVCWTAGADLGYRFGRYLASEIGSFYLPKTEYRAKSSSYWVSPTGDSASFGYSNVLLYLALKGFIPLSRSFELFFKFGVGLNHAIYNGDWDFSYAHQGIMHFGNWERSGDNGVSPIFSFGGSYYFTHHVYLSLQYMLFGTSWNSYHINSQAGTPDHRGLADNCYRNFGAIDLLTAGIGYAF